ncbi:Sister chromatid cohesion protein DCC1 [Geranomyces variabilis]|uniref:Sister chromatid cohesion protein DCC1 n=1 Tax=Geranomyces variabilis TaxID=109894 RepID=A0AAD5TEV8_9FUNG|nr:Sister chromatid cohesion protein DCC1 [Geranomyces variabilis]
MSDIVFSSDLDANADRFFLLELPAEVAALYAATPGSSPKRQPVTSTDPSPLLVIRGLPNDEAVLCTRDATYAIREVQTSNTTLLTRKQAEGYSVDACMSGYMELVPTRPRVDKLRELLEAALYDGPVEEERERSKRLRSNEPQRKTYTHADLEALVQCSTAELANALTSLGAVCISSTYRILSPTYLATSLRLLLASLVAEDLDVRDLDVEDCISAMAGEADEVPETVVRGILDQFWDIKPDGRRAINEGKVARFFGETLLQNAESRKTPLSTFLTTWSSALPPPLSLLTSPPSAALAHIAGLYLLSDTTTPTPSIIYFPKRALPPDAKPRFEALFRMRRRWKRDEMLPYIDDLAPTEKKLDAILLKFARTSKDSPADGGGTVYTSRYAVQ